MEVKSRYIIIAGFIVASIHLILSLFNYSIEIKGLTGQVYSLSMALFFTGWGVMQLILPRIQQYYPMHYGLFRRKEYRLLQYYKSSYSREVVMNNLRYQLRENSVPFELNDNHEIRISHSKKINRRTPVVGIKIFEDQNGTTISTETLNINDEYISIFKLSVAALLWITTFWGVVAVVFVFLIHFISMFEMFTTQSGAESHKKEVHKLIEESIDEIME